MSPPPSYSMYPSFESQLPNMFPNNYISYDEPNPQFHVPEPYRPRPIVHQLQEQGHQHLHEYRPSPVLHQPIQEYGYPPEVNPHPPLQEYGPVKDDGFSSHYSVHADTNQDSSLGIKIQDSSPGFTHQTFNKAVSSSGQSTSKDIYSSAKYINSNMPPLIYYVTICSNPLHWHPTHSAGMIPGSNPISPLGHHSNTFLPNPQQIHSNIYKDSNGDYIAIQMPDEISTPSSSIHMLDSNYDAKDFASAQNHKEKQQDMQNDDQLTTSQLVPVYSGYEIFSNSVPPKYLSWVPIHAASVMSQARNAAKFRRNPTGNVVY